ncbi:hypothetical protein FKR81_34165 [Lentzea tibetensis]|uniref:Uncharacterized protein n=1 Tax=Lentzea tibetensis TaxID=2591470 RepID=A0A563EJ33_9PSEU|nr:hypothetical protein [Lentzea tibetensis]TWP46857.1 hypothetical protein FKR81_34165 [Lentzea tibetensis]
MDNRFFAIHDSSGVLRAVGRMWQGADEAYTDGLYWETCDQIGTPPGQRFSWRGWTDLVLEELPDEQAADALLFIITARGREIAHASDDLERYAIFRAAEAHPFLLDNAYTLIRRALPDGPEEELARDGQWRPANRLDEIRDGDGHPDVCLRLAEREMDWHEERLIAPRYTLVRDGAGQPLAVVREVGGAEEAYTRDLAWAPSHLLDRPDLTFQRFQYPRQGQAELLEFAHTVRDERQRTEWAGEYDYFADLVSQFAEPDPDLAVSVVRRSRDGCAEVFFAEGVWLRTAAPLRIGELFFQWSNLPVTADEAERITRRIASSEEPRYFVVTDDAEERENRRSTAVAVVRLTGTAGDAFTRDLAWRPYDLPGTLADQPRWTVRAVTEGAARQEEFYVHDRVRHARQVGEWVGEYDYFAIFDGTLEALDLDNAFMLVRRSTPSGEEQYSGNRQWGSTDKLYRLSSGRDWTEESLPISPAEAEHLRRKLDERWNGWRRYYAVTADDGPPAVVMLSTPRHAAPSELAFTGEFGWKVSDLLRRAATVDEIEPDRAVELMGTLVGDHRYLKQQEHYGAGYAVFRRWDDVVDLESALRLVGQPGPGDEVAVPITAHESERLAKMIFLRRAEERAEPADDHRYFAVFDYRGNVMDLDAAYAVIRCPAEGTEPWETFVRDGEWRTTRAPHQVKTVPITAADVDRVTRRIAATEHTRYFDVRGDRGRVAIVRLTGSVEEALARDVLEWAPSDLFERVRTEPELVAEEFSESSGTMAVFYQTQSVRAERQKSERAGDDRYFAIFADLAAALDVGNALVVVRRRGEAEEKFVRPGEWVPTDELSRLEGKAPFQPYLAISAEEAERLTRGAGTWRERARRWLTRG